MNIRFVSEADVGLHMLFGSTCLVGHVASIFNNAFQLLMKCDAFTEWRFINPVLICRVMPVRIAQRDTEQ